MNVPATSRPLAQRMAPKLLALTLLASAMSAAQAAYLVDTGLPTPGGTSLVNYTVDFGGGEFYDQQQYLAASFTLAEASTITSLGAYMYNNGSGSVTYELHQGGPTGDLVFSSSIAVGSTPDYYTISDMNVAVDAGVYTLNFIASYGFNGYLESGAPGSPDALTTTYFSNDATTWTDIGVQSYGIQVGGTASGGATGVPAPLPLLGVIGAFGWSRKLRSRIKRASQLS